MKTTLIRAAIVMAVALGLASAGLALGDEQTPAARKQVTKDKTYKGTVIAVDPKEHTLTVRGLLTTKNFNAAGECKVAFEDKADASWSDLRPGQEVELAYRNARGVLVTHQITQKNRLFKGHLIAIDPAKRSLAVKRGVFARHFTLTDGSVVLVKDDKSGSLNDLKIGDTVKVIYESESEPMLAQRVEQKNPTFVGTIRSIDAETRTVKVKNLLAEKKFHLANGCKVVVNGKMNAWLVDLRIGDRMSVSYEDVNGVLVANRITREEGAPEADSSQTARVNDHSR